MPASRSHAFTIIELLVVITIIVVLLALLAPALDRAISHAEDLRCATNQKAVGNATALYHLDFKRRYPLVAHFNLLFGKLGEKPFQGANADSHQRPLNIYLGYEGPGNRVPVAECPRDQGDPFVDGVVQREPADNCYIEFGSSYIVPLNWRQGEDAWFRIKFTYGQAGNPTTFPSARQSSFTRPSNKVILSDWPVFGDRPIRESRTQWHDTERRLFNNLYADFHVELFDYPIEEMETMPPGSNENAIKPPDPSFLWW